MSGHEFPIPEERGALVPPSRRPPTAVGLETPPPPEPSRPAGRSAHRSLLVRLLDAALDVGDEFAKAVRAVFRGAKERVREP